MSNEVEIEAIREQFARQYSIDLAALKADADVLRSRAATVRSSDNTDAIALYENGETYTADFVDAKVPDLETEPLSAIPSDSRITSRNIELNFEECLRYLQSALQIRIQYGELGKLRNDTRLKGEEFIRLDLIHLDEVRAGLYELPWREAEDDVTGLSIAVEDLEEQKAIPDEMFGNGAGGQFYSGILTRASMSTNIQQSAQITRDTANTNKAQVFELARDTNEFRSALELATWESALATVKASLAQLKGKLATAERKEDYLSKDVMFRAHRASVSRQLAWAQLNEHTRPGSILNYDERLTRCRELYLATMACLIQRVSPLVQGVRTYYGVDPKFIEPKPGNILDYLAVWLLNLQNELLNTKRAQTVAISSFWSGRPKDSMQVGDGTMKKIAAEFIIDAAALPRGRRLLRGVAFEYIGGPRRPIVVDVFPPAGVLEKAATLRFGRVCEVSSAVELMPQHSEVTWNADPVGTWTLEVIVDAAESIADFGMHLWVAS